MCKVSVLMPVYNAEKYLAEAIDSIIAQTFTDWELIIIDDGSTDKSNDIITSYSDQRIRYSRNEGNKGLVYTRNLMISMAGGEYIAFLDSDDISLSQRLEQQVLFLDTNPSYGACGTWSYLINEDSKKIKALNFPVEDKEIKCMLLFVNTFVQSSVLIRRELLLGNKYDVDYPLAEDYELWCRLSRICKLKNIPQHLTQYRWHTANISKEKKDHLNSLTKNIYRRELKQIGIQASSLELTIHSAIRDKSVYKETDSRYLKELKPWLQKLHKSALATEMYDKNTLSAVLCFRWIFVCKERKQYFRILSLPIIPNLNTLGILIKMLYTRL